MSEQKQTADQAMRQIWAEWLAFYRSHSRKEGLGISALPIAP